MDLKGVFVFSVILKYLCLKCCDVNFASEDVGLGTINTEGDYWSWMWMFAIAHINKFLVILNKNFYIFNVLFISKEVCFWKVKIELCSRKGGDFRGSPVVKTPLTGGPGSILCQGTKIF